MFPMFSPFSVETEYFFFFSFLEAGCVSLQLYMKSISHVSKHNINKQQCCHSCAISRLLSAFGIAFLTLFFLHFPPISPAPKCFPLYLWVGVRCVVCFFFYLWLSLIAFGSKHWNRLILEYLNLAVSFVVNIESVAFSARIHVLKWK